MNEEKKSVDFLQVLKTAPVILKYVSKHWNNITKAWELLKPLFADIANELRKKDNLKENAE